VLILPSFKYRTAGLLAAWGFIVGVGILLLDAYAARPGTFGSSPERWPAGSILGLDSHRPTLLVFLHPRCPCSRASLAELASVMARCGDRVSAHALVFRPAQLPERWDCSGIEQDLRSLPDVATRPDLEGLEARRFGVATSGHVLLYDTRGRLLFSGGITPARGHQGENYGRSGVLARILGTDRERPVHPVFGCPLGTPQLSLRQESR
jgi:hypothetical protein